MPYVWLSFYRQILNSQALHLRTVAIALQTERLGALHLINHFLGRLDLEARLDRFVPTQELRVRLPYAKARARISHQAEPIF